MKKTQRKSLACRWFYMWYRFPLTYVNFSFDFLDLDNVFLENYFANELTKWRSFFKPFKTLVYECFKLKHSYTSVLNCKLVDRVLSHIKHSATRRVL